MNSRTSGALLGITIQSVLYGMYLATTVVSTYSMYYIRARSIKPNQVLLGVSVSLFIAITLYWGLNIVSVVEEIIGHEGGPPGSPSNMGQVNAASLTRLGIFYLVNFLMDGLLIYRLYVIYIQDLRVIVLPVLATLVSAISVIMQLALSAQVKSWASDTGAIARLKFILAPLSLSISAFVCVYSTSFIIYRILLDGRAFRQFRTKNLLGPALYIMIESAFVYTVLIILFLVFFLVNSPSAASLLTFSIPPFIGLNYSLVLTHVGLGLTNISQSYTTRLSTTRSLGLQRSVVLDRGEDRAVMVVTTERAVGHESIDGDEMTDQPDGKDTERAKSQTIAPFNDPTSIV